MKKSGKYVQIHLLVWKFIKFTLGTYCTWNIKNAEWSWKEKRHVFVIYWQPFFCRTWPIARDREVTSADNMSFFILNLTVTFYEEDLFCLSFEDLIFCGQAGLWEESHRTLPEGINLFPGISDQTQLFLHQYAYHSWVSTAPYSTACLHCKYLSRQPSFSS